MCLLHNKSCILFVATVTKELKGFIVNSLSELISGYRLAISNALLAHNIYKATGKLIICGQVIQHVMRGLRVKFDKFIVGLEVCVFFPLSNHFQQIIYDSLITNLVIFIFFSSET